MGCLTHATKSFQLPAPAPTSTTNPRSRRSKTKTRVAADFVFNRNKKTPVSVKKQAFSREQILEIPSATNEDMDAVTIFVMMRSPDCAGMRRTAPTTVFPHPMTVPHPCAPDPNKGRPRRNRLRFDNDRWRRFRHHLFGCWSVSCRRRPINGSFAYDATAQQQGAGRRQQYGI